MNSNDCIKMVHKALLKAIAAVLQSICKPTIAPSPPTFGPIFPN